MRSLASVNSSFSTSMCKAGYTCSNCIRISWPKRATALWWKKSQWPTCLSLYSKRPGINRKSLSRWCRCFKTEGMVVVMAPTGYLTISPLIKIPWIRSTSTSLALLSSLRNTLRTSCNSPSSISKKLMKRLRSVSSDCLWKMVPFPSAWLTRNCLLVRRTRPSLDKWWAARLGKTLLAVRSSPHQSSMNLWWSWTCTVSLSRPLRYLLRRPCNPTAKSSVSIWERSANNTNCHSYLSRQKVKMNLSSLRTSWSISRRRSSFSCSAFSSNAVSFWRFWTSSMRCEEIVMTPGARMKRRSPLLLTCWHVIWNGPFSPSWLVSLRKKKKCRCYANNSTVLTQALWWWQTWDVLGRSCSRCKRSSTSSSATSMRRTISTIEARSRNSLIAFWSKTRQTKVRERRSRGPQTTPTLSTIRIRS